MEALSSSGVQFCLHRPSGRGVVHLGGTAQRAQPVPSESYDAKKMLLKMKPLFLRVKVSAAAPLPVLSHP